MWENLENCLNSHPSMVYIRLQPLFSQLPCYYSNANIFIRRWKVDKNAMYIVNEINGRVEITESHTALYAFAIHWTRNLNVLSIIHFTCNFFFCSLKIHFAFVRILAWFFLKIFIEQLLTINKWQLLFYKFRNVCNVTIDYVELRRYSKTSLAGITQLTSFHFVNSYIYLYKQNILFIFSCLTIYPNKLYHLEMLSLLLFEC